MRLDFNVLWVEDQHRNVQAQKEKLERLIRNEGFRLKVEFAASVEEAKRWIGDSVYADHIDLILMDYNLGAAPHGDTGLQEVRASLPYKDVIFYSAQANDLRRIVSEANVEGVYLSSRQDLPETAESLFLNLVRKVLDIDHSRGLVMGATSELDHYVNDCLEHVFNRFDGERQEKIINLILAKLEEKRSEYDELLKEVAVIKHVSDVFDKHSVYTSVDRLHLLRKAFKLGGLFADKDTQILDYANLMPRRNDLAHVRVKTEGFTRKLYNRKNVEFTDKEMKNLRLALLQLQELFEELFAELEAMPKN